MTMIHFDGTFYGIESWRTWCASAPLYLGNTKQRPQQIQAEEPFNVCAYRDLFQIVSFLNVMNKEFNLLFRGQGHDYPLEPSILRENWEVSDNNGIVRLSEDRQYYWQGLAPMCDWVSEILRGKLPRHAPFDQYTYPGQKHLRIAPWAVIQHYGLWPTPLLDMTSSLRVAASFALGLPKTRGAGILYVFAIPHIVSDVMDSSVINNPLAVRLSSVCPPIASRPHLQEGYLFGNPNFEVGDLAQTGVPSASGWLVAKFRLENLGRGGPAGGTGFWDRDFPKHTAASLLSARQNDSLSSIFEERIRYRTEDDRAVAHLT
jgi:FRG domain